MSDNSLIHQLLFEEEGTTLDFKREQYRFSNGTDEEKSELLKDILAFANTWRRTDAYILVGVKEIKGGHSEVIGIDNHLEDAHIQQFVNSKTQRPVEFSYKAFQVEGRQIGIIHIPVQRRPVYLNKDFGSLSRHTVYIRRSSSTGIASPDEISTMGAAVNGGYQEIPELESFLVFGEHDEMVEKSANERLINATIPSDTDFPDYETEKIDMGFGMTINRPGITTNYNYYRDRAKFIQAFLRVHGFKLAVRNLGEMPARDVKVVFGINSDNGTVIVCQKSDLPRQPFAEKSLFNPYLPTQTAKVPDVAVKRTASGWRVTCQLGKIQPKDITITDDRIYLGATISKNIPLNVQIFGDDLPEPKNEILEVGYEVEERIFSIRDFIPDYT